MTRSPITLCLYTSTRGHFGGSTYQETVTSLLSQVSADTWGAMIAHVKVSTGDEARAQEMSEWLHEQGFYVANTTQDWRHGDQTHQDGYLQDALRVTSLVKTPFLMHHEDDFLLRPYAANLNAHLYQAVVQLEEDPELMQVRIPRYSNEVERILGLRAKHGIDGRAEWSTNRKWFRHNDLSMNPFIARTRDMRAAFRLVMMSNLPKHIEHGTAAALKVLSSSPLPFACFNPESLRCGHIGVARPEERDNLNQSLLAT